jgi:hypothetical protein
MSIIEHGDAISPIEWTEDERVLFWRAERLERAGYDDLAVPQLAMGTEVDSHLAVGLVERGRPPETALRILL